MSTHDDQAMGAPEATPSGDAEALGTEREEYPDPKDYPLPDTSDGSTPDADLQVSDPSGGDERNGLEPDGTDDMGVDDELKKNGLPVEGGGIIP